MRRTLVSLPDGAWDAIDKELRPQLGNADSEIIRNIVLAYLIEKATC
ncbi:MAG: CopG family transcriptional regulator [Thaumarchaeota archaeon]|nr:MAG: CopG family transcriptional regulator [Nitrososphaerota archaeon]